MSFCQIQDGQVVNISDRLPQRAPLERTGQIIENLPELGDVMWRACGWYVLRRTAKPVDTSTTTWDETHQVIDGRPQVVWVERDKTPVEAIVPPPTVEQSAGALSSFGELPPLPELSDEEVAAISAVFPPLLTGVRAKVGHLYQWSGTVVEIVQDHVVSLEEWVPGAGTEALYRLHRADGGVREWKQPTGAHDAVRRREVVTKDGLEYESLIPANVTVPGSDDRWWKLLTVAEPPTEPVGPAPWKVWSGRNEDLYQVGDEVTHAGKTWRSNTANNHWEPGDFGWDQIS